MHATSRISMAFLLLILISPVWAAHLVFRIRRSIHFIRQFHRWTLLFMMTALVGLLFTISYTHRYLVTSYRYILAGVNGNPTKKLASVHINPRQPSLAIPATFLGFSHEWGGAQIFMGSPSTGTNPIYRQLVKNLFAYGAGPLIVRVGGGSTDTSAAPTAGEVDAFAQLYHDVGAKFYLGVNLGSNNVNLATDQAQFYAQHMPAGSLLGMEIGNEVDDYQFNGIRSSAYAFNNFLSEWRRWQTAINIPVIAPGTKFMGPSFGGQLPWVWTSKYLTEFVNSVSGNLNTVSQHWYAGSHCGANSNPPDYLLQPQASKNGMQAINFAVAPVHGAGLSLRMGEMNSIVCSGEPGVSDTFASALWTIDTMFELASAGVDGVNFHMDLDDFYGAFLFNVNTSTTPHTYTINVIRPEYYGMLFFQQAAANGAKLLPVTVSTSANLKIWATVDNTKRVRIALINKDKGANVTATIHLSGYRTGMLTRLLASSYQAKTGITLAGQTFDSSKDGTPQGTPKSESVSPRAGHYWIPMPPTSAALLTVEVSKLPNDLR